MDLGASFGKNVSPFVSIRFDSKFGNFSSLSNFDKQYIKGNYQDFFIVGLTDFVDIFGYKKSDWDIYLITGVGVSRYRTGLFNSIDDSLTFYTPNDSAKYRNIRYDVAFTIPLGVGVNYKIGDNWMINFETNIRYYFNDELDANISTKRNIEGISLLSIGVIYRFDFPRGGLYFKRGLNSNFSARKDKSPFSYRKKRHNGTITSDPFKNRKNKRSTSKTKYRSKYKKF